MRVCHLEGILSLYVIGCAHVAQLVEHVLGKDEVTGSIPVVGYLTEYSLPVVNNNNNRQFGDEYLISGDG